MRWFILVLNILAAVAFLVLASVAVAVHRTHALSTYVELEQNHALVARPTYANGQPMDVAARLRMIGGGGVYYSLFGYLAGGACLLNGSVFFFSHAPRRPEKTA